VGPAQKLYATGPTRTFISRGFSEPGSRYRSQTTSGSSEKIGLLALKETMMLVRLKLEDTREGLVATISQRDDDGKTSGRPSIFLVGDKEEAKQKARAVARGLGLKTYRVLDMTRSRMPPTIRPAWSIKTAWISTAFGMADPRIVSDTGEPDRVASGAQQHSVEDLPDDALVFLLGSRYCETDRLSEIA
jgi:hypothetical protein